MSVEMSNLCFSRKKHDKRKSFGQSISAGNSPLHTKTRPTSQALNIAPRTSAYEDRRIREWDCGLCKKELVEPRLLGCLHNFCTRCLQGLHQEGEAEVWSEIDGASIQLDAGESRSGSGAGSAGSGYESDLRHSGSEGSLDHKPQKYGIFSRKVSGKTVQFILCPNTHVLQGLMLTCKTAEIPQQPYLSYTLFSMRLAQSVVNFYFKIKDNNRVNLTIANISESSISINPNLNLKVEPLHPIAFCTNANPRETTHRTDEVICRDCCVISHGGHALANASRAAAERARILRDACDRAKHVPENVERATRTLHVCAYEVDRHDRAEQRLLSEGKEDEVLSLSGAVLRRLEVVSELQPLSDPPKLELRFAPLAPATHDSTLFGRLLTQAPDPEACVLSTEGLQDLRVDGEHEAILELRDSSGERIWCGGEQVAGFFRRRDSSARPATASITDRADGTYSITFTPTSPGAYLLAITLNNKPIKGSPFACAVRVLKSHTGTYHCCSFCSSGGKRDATCGCGGTMAGGYKGCGHGHAGWPGTRHWSCCGATQKNSLCTKPPRAKSQLYQFSL
ncbi:hypothetical protein K1T71_002306 [Dendrolimus kikuchii]|uniref:Uncharacterized protein n=1 Tax=Dendrolimus kikuchii TaxID=765133 RepID=A0ACC1DCX0_9NEOP|nr:hypothetical protein K1T71_002306 [Dendrolimus kikuchii]